MLSPLVVLTVYALTAFRQAHAALTNITIDDTNSTYWTFVGSYNAVTPSTPCSGCVAQPDPTLVFNHTWHDGALRSGSFVFQGTAVYIYGIDVVDPANITFAMNNPSVTSFHYYSGDGYIYNSLFFSATNLDPSVQHTVTWLMETSSNGGGSALFDYAKVTIDQADASSSSASNSKSSSAGSTTGGASLTSSPSSASSPSPNGTARGVVSPSPSSTTSGTVSPIKSHSKTCATVGTMVAVVVGLALFGA